MLVNPSAANARPASSRCAESRYRSSLAACCATARSVSVIAFLAVSGFIPPESARPRKCIRKPPHSGLPSENAPRRFTSLRSAGFAYISRAAPDGPRRLCKRFRGPYAQSLVGADFVALWRVFEPSRPSSMSDPTRTLSIWLLHHDSMRTGNCGYGIRRAG